MNLKCIPYFVFRECILDSTLDDSLKSRMNDPNEIIQTLLNFVWNFWDHPLEVGYTLR